MIMLLIKGKSEKKTSATYHPTRWVHRRCRRKSGVVLSHAAHLSTWMIAGYAHFWVLSHNHCESHSRVQPKHSILLKRYKCDVDVRMVIFV